MAPAKIEWSQTYAPAVLRGVLADAAKALPEANRNASLMACLAEKILILAAGGRQNPVDLRRIAVERVRESCPDCRACEGLHSCRNRDRSSPS